MARRVCNVPGCPAISDAARCPQHARPSRQQRGYDAAHDREAAEWRAKVAAGSRVICWRCGEPITDPDDCHLGHDDYDRTITRGPEHGRRCNLSAAGRSAHH